MNMEEHESRITPVLLKGIEGLNSQRKKHKGKTRGKPLLDEASQHVVDRGWVHSGSGLAVSSKVSTVRCAPP